MVAFAALITSQGIAYCAAYYCRTGNTAKRSEKDRTYCGSYDRYYRSDNSACRCSCFCTNDSCTYG